MTGNDHAIHPEPTEKALAALIARLGCEHSHGMRPPRNKPCAKHRENSAWWGYVLAGHLPELRAALGEDAPQPVPEDET